MIQLRHTGIYVKDLKKMTDFYKNVFDMIIVVKEQYQDDDLIKDLLLNENAQIKITKLITEQGKVSGFDDMIELIEVISPLGISVDSSSDKIFYKGCVHVGFAIPDIDITIKKIKSMGGYIITDIHSINNKKCCFAKDIEGNYMELIENKEA